MEPGIWQQSSILIDILNNAHKYSFHQLLFLIEQMLPESGDESFEAKIKLRPDDSLAFPASDVRAVQEISGNRYEVIARFMGLYGVDSPLPQYFLDDVTEGGDSGERLKSFLDVFNHRLYSLLHQVWKKQNLFTRLDEKGLYYRLVSGMTGQYWCREQDVMAFGGSFLGRFRDVESIEEILKEAMSLNELEIEDEVISWVAVEDGLQLSGQQALGLDTCLGDAFPMMGKKLSIKVGPVDQAVSDQVKPSGDMGRKMATLLRTYLPEGVDFDVSIQLTPKLKQDWILGSEQSFLAVHTQFGESSGRGLTFQLSSDQYFETVYN